MNDDARTARADAKAAKAKAKALRPWFKKKRIILPLVLLVIIVFSAVASSGSKDDTNTTASSDGSVQSLSSNDDNKPADDVTVSECQVDSSIGSVKALLDIKNASSKRSDYIIEVAFEDAAGTHVGDGMANASNVEPGQAARAEAVDFVEGDGLSCKITDVNRFASN